MESARKRSSSSRRVSSMWWSETPRKIRVMIRLCAALALAGLTAGCFQPLYGTQGPVGAVGIGNKLVSVEVRNSLMYDLTGGGGAAATNYKLDIRLTSSQLQVIVDLNTARPDIQNYGIDASYTLTDITTGKKVITGQTFSRVSYNIPGQQQRFAGDRGLRDAENRAAKVISDNIRSRLASYFVAGTERTCPGRGAARRRCTTDPGRAMQ